MPSRSDRRAGDVFERWNRRLHYYLGLYFLLFLWLFSVTGLLLNHPHWALSRIPNDANPPREQTIAVPVGDTDLSRAKDVMRQLGLKGEIDWPQESPRPGRFDFNIAYPKGAYQVRVDLASKRATVVEFDRTFWSGLRISHTFSGSRYNAPNTSRDWLLTSLWTIAMDAFAIGLLVMVLGSYYMWYRLKAKRAAGVVALLAGLVSFALVLAGVGG